MNINLLVIAKTLASSGFDVAYNFKDDELVLPHCGVYEDQGKYVLVTNDEKTIYEAAEDLLKGILNLGQFAKVRVSAELTFVVLIQPHTTFEEIMKLNPPFEIDPSTVKFISQEISYGLHGT